MISCWLNTLLVSNSLRGDEINEIKSLKYPFVGTTCPYAIHKAQYVFIISIILVYYYFLLIIYLFFTYSVSSGDRHIRNNIFILSKYFKMSEQMILSRKLRDILLLNVNLSISIRYRIYRINLDFSSFSIFSNHLSCNLWIERFIKLMTKQQIISAK